MGKISTVAETMVKNIKALSTESLIQIIQILAMELQSRHRKKKID